MRKRYFVNICFKKSAKKQQKRNLTVVTVNYAVYNFILMRLKKVMNVNVKFHCESCGTDTTATFLDTMSGAMLSNLAGFLSIAECYFHNA